MSILWNLSNIAWTVVKTFDNNVLKKWITEFKNVDEFFAGSWHSILSNWNKRIKITWTFNWNIDEIESAMWWALVNDLRYRWNLSNKINI